MISGYGYTNNTQTGWNLSNSLQVAHINAVDIDNCTKIYKKMDPTFEGHFCAAGKGPEMADSCEGDSGGPVTFV